MHNHLKLNIMKKIHLLIAVAGMMLLVTACRFGGRHNTIVENSNGRYVKVEYYGQVYFTEDKKDIKFITPHGQLKFSTNSDDLLAENDHGKIVYEINGGGKQTQLDEDQKMFLARAIHEMIRLGHSSDK
jgi:hypothetical protein